MQLLLFVLPTYDFSKGKMYECSNQGYCNRDTGMCQCYREVYPSAAGKMLYTSSSSDGHGNRVGCGRRCTLHITYSLLWIKNKTKIKQNKSNLTPILTLLNNILYISSSFYHTLESYYGLFCLIHVHAGITRRLWIYWYGHQYLHNRWKGLLLWTRILLKRHYNVQVTRADAFLW